MIVVKTGVVFSRTAGPGEWDVETLYEILETPGDDCVVVESNIESHNSTRQTQSTQIWTDLLPDSDGAFPQSLTNSELQDEERETQEEESYHVGNQESS